MRRSRRLHSAECARCNSGSRARRLRPAHGFWCASHARFPFDTARAPARDASSHSITRRCRGCGDRAMLGRRTCRRRQRGHRSGRGRQGAGGVGGGAGGVSSARRAGWCVWATARCPLGVMPPPVVPDTAPSADTAARPGQWRGAVAGRGGGRCLRKLARRAFFRWEVSNLKICARATSVPRAARAPPRRPPAAASPHTHTPNCEHTGHRSPVCGHRRTPRAHTRHGERRPRRAPANLARRALSMGGI